MFLRQLTLKGFKSFADATTLTLEPGVTVVVGPNGSGKSNVVDAIAWVLGAQAPSLVRSQKMEDVIFAGTAKRPALGRAEVTLTIDNTNRLLPIEFTEISITRTLWRSGESEYAINGVGCRLLDVQELLSDAGVGRQQHVIVSQGQIDAILNARPEDRRAVIEEAAGVLKYRKRKERAERRLEATEGNLLRVQDLLREVRRQLRPLERQAEAARRHGDLVAELHELQRHLAGRELAHLGERLTTLAAERQHLGAEERAMRADLAERDRAVAAAEHRLAATGAADLGDDLARTEQLRERARGLAARLAERRRSLARQLAEAGPTDAVAVLERDVAELRRELVEVEAAAAALQPQDHALALEEAEVAAARAKADEALTPADSTRSASGAAAEVRGELRSRRAALERAEGERRRLEARLHDLEQRAVRLDDTAARHRADCEAAQADEAPLVAELAAAEARRAAADEAVERLTAQRQTAADDVTAWQARTEALALALDQARARAGVEGLDGVDGVVGTLLDLIAVDEGWEAAFEAAAGPALAAVVMGSVGSARAALDHLHERSASGAVLALGRPATGPSTPGVGEPVRRHVRGRQPGIDALLDALVGSAVAVTGGWPAALDVALDHPWAVVVTPQGDRFGPDGWRVGGGSAGATGAALEEARRLLGEATIALAEADSALARARTEVTASREVEHALARRLDAADTRFSSATAALNRVLAERRDIATEVEALRSTAAELDERLARDRARVSELDALLPGLEADESAEAEQARARALARARLDETAAAVAARRRDLAVRSTGLAERRRFLERRLTDVTERLEAAQRASAEALVQRGTFEATLAVLARLDDVVAQRQEVVEAELAVLHDRRRRQSEQTRAAARELDELRAERHALDTRLEATRERARRIELDEAELRVRREAAEDTLRRDLHTEPDDAIALPCPPVPEGTTAPARVRDLERELRQLGPINPLALEEFTALKERHEFLERELEDVRTTRRELLRVIKAVDTEIEQTFAAAFADVSANFERLFATLFPGGHGRLVLTAPDDLLRTGIEVEAKPSGKNVKKLSLLSGGERSLTALAYLFAVFRARPSPFYVMDEVEAALDDVNLHRFLHLIEEFRHEAQLMIVSHQKRTMEAADVLYGVSMQPGGSSKVVTERIRGQATA